VAYSLFDDLGEFVKSRRTGTARAIVVAAGESGPA